MGKTHLGFPWTVFMWMILLYSVTLLATVYSQTSSASDAAVMLQLKKNLNPPSSLGWNGTDPCFWRSVQCKNDKRVTRIQIGGQGLSGSLPANLNSLTFLEIFEVYENHLSGPLPSLSGLSLLQRVMVRDNKFSSIPPDFFDGMTSLQSAILDYNPFSPWTIPDGLKSASALSEFSATSTNLVGPIPNFLGPDSFPSLTRLQLAFNKLEGGIPANLSRSSLQMLWLNGQNSSSKLNGSIAVIQNMTQLTEIWLQGNSFTGPLPDFSGLKQLQNVTLRDNQFTGVVPESLVNLPSLLMVNLTNNLLQGPTPKFSESVLVDMTGGNSFCLNTPGVSCDPKVNSLLAVAQDMGYPTQFASDWKGNDPCAGPWLGITCIKENITVVNFQNMKLTGTISRNFSSIASLQKLILANNNITGTIPDQLTSLPNLQLLDVSNNQLYGKVPTFPRNNVVVKTDGNVNIGKAGPAPTSAPGNTPGSSPGTSGGSGDVTGGGKKSSAGVIVGSVVGISAAIVVAGLLVFYIKRTKSKGSSRVQGPSTFVIHPRHSGSDQDTVKITIAGSGVDGATSENYSNVSSEPRDIHIVESNGLKIQIEVLKKVTNSFSEENILGKGGFGTVYKGELDDGTMIAVKRMESGVMSDKGLEEFQSEIAVVTKVRHRHLVALLGYCLDASERILVYEYMPQGALSRHLFNWKDEQLNPLDWMKRLTIALDVARGVEYLHSLAQQSFIHRDLKPSNILLGDDMRAKVADFGLVRLVPEGKGTVVTRLAGTFGYLAPEYAVMGRVTTKLDVFSFGVILMELITGRKALDETQPEESAHLVAWFRRILISKELQKAIDPTIDLTEETLASVSRVAELAGHCCAREPHQRPDMSHAVNVLSSLTELWKPAEPDPDDIYGIDYDMTLPQAVKKWQALEGMSSMESTSYFGSNDNTQTSIPTRPSGFADSFTSSDGR